MDQSKSSVIILRPSSCARVSTSSFEFQYSSLVSFRIMYSLSILYFAFFFCCFARSSSSEHVNKTESLMKIWADHAYKWFAGRNCTNEVNCTTETNCLLMKAVEKFNFRIYGAEPIVGQKFGAVFPDGDVKHRVFHDGVIVLDPFPLARFGHPILVFYANVSSNQTECESANGFLVEGQYCLQLLVRSPCVRNSKRGVRIWPGANIGQNCGEVVFLPMVYFQSEPARQINDRLQCYSNIEGFNRFCPQLRPEDRSKRVTCHPVVNNEPTCGSFANKIDNKCLTSQTCDHAILLSGGWNRQLSDVSTWNNIFNVKKLLMNHGFLESNIAMFFANGPKYTRRKPDNSDDDEDDDSYDAEFLEPERYFSSSMKDLMRNHIKNLCDSEYCADTVLIYLNSPTKPDGSSLLWDFSDDGVYSEDELYTPKDLYRDIYRCRANRVVILADQNYGNELVAAAVARLYHLENVVIFTAYSDFNANGTKDRLTGQLLREKYYDFCLSEFQNVINNPHKSPQFIGHRTNLLNSTLVGGPCFAKATSLNDPSVMKYRGCSAAPLV